jgi:hypothetical protein
MKLIQSLSQYIEEINKVEEKWGTTSNGFILYRGQKDQNWNLRPGLYRNYEEIKANSNPAEWMMKMLLTSAEINSLNGFIQKGIFFNNSTQNYSKLEWYFLSQHYGLKTRLLDWTTSYLVALFFALEKAQEMDSPVVYILDPAWLNFKYHFIEGSAYLSPYIFDRNIPSGLFETIEPELKKLDLDLMSYINYESRNFHPFPIAIKPMYFDERMYHQKAYFTVHGNIHNFYDLLLNDPKNQLISKKYIADSLFMLFSFNLFGENHIDKPTEKELKNIIKINLLNVESRFGVNNRIQKLVIDGKQIPKIKAQLSKAGIDFENIYPGFEGLAKDMNDFFEKNVKNFTT